jgi:hypothetical protein
MNELLGTSYDSTNNDLDGTPSGDVGQLADGKMYAGASFYGGNQNQISVADDSLLDPSSLSLEVWFTTDILPSSNGDLFTAVSKSDNTWADGYVMAFYRNDGSSWDGLTFFSDFGDWEPAIYPSTNFNTGQWYHAVGTYNSTADVSTLFVDGIERDSSDPWAGAIVDSSNTLKFGDNDWEEWDGLLDEIRISNIVRSDAWISTSFNNQNDTSSFYSVGSEESTGATIQYEWVELYNPGSSSIDLSGWYVSDNDGNTFQIGSSVSLAADSYLVLHLGEPGINSSTDIYGNIISENSISSVILQPGRALGFDCYISEANPDTNYGTSSSMELQEYNTGTKENLLLKFNHSWISSSNIVDANLWLYRSTGSTSSPAYVNVRRLTQSWTEDGANWTMYDGSNDWATDGGDYTDKIYTWTTVPHDTTEWYKWNVSELIEEWKDGTYDNNGMILEGDWQSSWAQFRTSDYNGDLTLRPKMIVNYSYTAPLKIAMLEDSDDLALIDESGHIWDYVVWGSDAGSDDNSAASWREWTGSDYIDTSDLLTNQTIGRDAGSNDTDEPEDWENASGKADPFGIDRSTENGSSPAAQNIDFIIPEFSDIVLPFAFTFTIFAIWKRKSKRKKG